MPNPEKILLLMSFSFLIFFMNCNQNRKPKEKNIPISITTDSTTQIISPEPEKINNTEKYLINMGMVNIRDSIEEIIVDLKYSGNDNFLGIDFYGELENAYVQPECLEKLKIAYLLLQEQKPGYTFIIYDAARSIESQQLMWDSLKVPENKKFWYVANPEKGSIHNYGMALDISIVDNYGNILDMGTEFDYFGELAFPGKTKDFFKKGYLNEIQYTNRNLLMDIMEKSGFYVSTTEWWHYNASSLKYAKENYPIISINENNLSIYNDSKNF